MVNFVFFLYSYLFSSYESYFLNINPKVNTLLAHKSHTQQSKKRLSVSAWTKFRRGRTTQHSSAPFLLETIKMDFYLSKLQHIIQRYPKKIIPTFCNLLTALDAKVKSPTGPPASGMSSLWTAAAAVSSAAAGALPPSMCTVIIEGRKLWGAHV